MTEPVSFAARVKPLMSAFQKADLEILIELIVLVAYADGEVDVPELEAIRESFETMLGTPLSTLVVNTLIGSAVDDIKAAGVSAFATQLGKELGARQKGIEGLRLGYAIANANRDLSSYETERLLLIAEAAGVSGEDVRSLEAEATT